MAELTTNLGLTLIDPSDYVDPEPINENFKFVDKLAIDYVTEQGKSGEWWYRKWKSGRLECGVDSKQFESKPMHAWGNSENNLWATQQYSFGAYPFAFSSNPYYSVTFLSDTLKNPYGCMILYFNNSSVTTMSPKFEILTSARDDNMQPVCGIYACGWYK